MGLARSLRTVLRRIVGPPSVGEGADDPAADADIDQHVAAVEVKLGYTFRDPKLLRNALLHRSHIHVTGQEREESNERLEFLGDAVLGLLVNDHLYGRYPERSEGDLTKMKSLLVCGARLSEVAVAVDLGIHIRMSRSEAATGGRSRSSILADTTEALIGAVYLDGGLEPARRVVDRIVLMGSDLVLKRRSLRNYKSRLQEMIQALHKNPPRYKILSVEGPDHDRTFKVAVTFDGEILGTGEGSNKKAAEQSAAREALANLENVPAPADDPT